MSASNNNHRSDGQSSVPSSVSSVSSSVNGAEGSATGSVAQGRGGSVVTRSRHWYRWRPVDITVASVIGVASGLVFWAFDLIVTAPTAVLKGFVPGLEGALNGFWYFGGVLALIIVRKPGAGLYAETVGALLELALGNQWGAAGSLVAGIVQGVFAEIGFLIVAYKLWNVWTATLSGVTTAIGGAAWSLVTAYAGMSSMGYFGVMYIVASCVSGAIVSGALMWFLYLGIARTGALSRFESDRIATARA